MAQNIKPVSDVADGDWIASVGNNLAAVLDEAVQDDTDYIYVSGTSTTGAQVELADATDPSRADAHIVSYRVTGNNQANLIVSLLENTNVRATWIENTVPSEYTNYARTLTNAEADSITDYTDLRLLFELEQDTTAPTLVDASAGTPTSDGTSGASVITNEDGGNLYWAVVRVEGLPQTPNS